MPDEGFWDRLSSVFARDPGGQVRFRRPAVQEAAYASLPFKLRRELHAAVGLRLERDHSRTLDADPALLSHHFAAAGDYVRAHRYAMVAAGRATERFSHADAAELYRRAIETGRAGGMAADAPALAEAWEKLGDALRCTGELQAAARALTEARRLCHDPIAQARLCDSQAEVAERCEALTAAVRWLTRGLRYIEGLQTTGARIARARIRSHLGGIRNRQGRWSEAVRVFRQAIADAETVGELPALARACYGLDWALVELGTAAEATHSWRALEIYEQLGDFEHEATVLNYLGMFAYFDGRWDEAIELYRRAGEASERAGVPADAAYTDCNVGEILSDQGRLDEAAAHLERARRVWLATGELPSVAFVDAAVGPGRRPPRRVAGGSGAAQGGHRPAAQVRRRRVRGVRASADRRGGGLHRGSLARAQARPRSASNRRTSTALWSSAHPASRWPGLVAMTRRRSSWLTPCRRRGSGGPTTRSPRRSTCWTPSTGPTTVCAASGTRSSPG